MAAQIISFPTYRERLRKRIQETIEEATDFLDDSIRASVINDLMKFVDLWAEDEQFTVTFEVPENEAFSEAQLKAMHAAIQPYGDKMRLKASYLLAELVALRMRVATCETLHGHDQ